MSEELAIQVEELTRVFGPFRAVDGVSFSVKKGEIYGFLGANGAGKSTTIRMLCGLLEPTSGRANVAGFDVGSQPEKVKARIGYMSQKFSLYGDLTVDENISFFGGIYGLAPSRLEQRRQEVLSLLQLESRRQVLAGELPRGIQQRLGFACAILHEPAVIFLDEPTSGVDPVQRRNFWDLIYDFSNKGVTVFVTTHFLEEAEFCHRIALIIGGKLVADDSPTDFKKRLSDHVILEVQCEPTVKALEAISDAPWARQASIFGSAIHVSTRGLPEPEVSVRNFLEEKGFSVARAERVEPSLEDVFLHLVENQN